jgi:hypothetical protein
MGYTAILIAVTLTMDLLVLNATTVVTNIYLTIVVVLEYRLFS